MLSKLATTYGETADAFDYLVLSIRYQYDSGSFSILLTSLALFVVLFDRLGHYEAAATVSGFTVTPFTRSSLPEIEATITHLRKVLGDEIYECFAHAGEGMTNAGMVSYAFEQIDRARLLI